MEPAHQDLDETQLAELREDLGDAFPAFVGEFLEAARGLHAGIESDLGRGDLAAAAARAHKVKGTAGYLGALKLVDRLGQLQRAAQAGDGNAVRDLLQGLEGDVAALAAKLAAHAGPG